MALVVLLRGVNVGGHRTFRPSVLAGRLKHLDVGNIGAAGTFVGRRPASRAGVRREFAGRLPFAGDLAEQRRAKRQGAASLPSTAGAPTWLDANE